VKAKRRDRLKTITREGRTQYLVAIGDPNHYDPSVLKDEVVGRDIDALNGEMVAARDRDLAACSGRYAARGRSGCSPMAMCSSPMSHTSKPRGRWPVCGAGIR
jgi:hypothetical protein